MRWASSWVIVIALAGTAAAEPRWHIVPPADWAARPDAESLPAIVTERANAEHSGMTDVHAWLWSPGAPEKYLQVMTVRGPATHDPPNDLEALVAGATAGVTSPIVIREPYGVTIDVLRGTTRIETIAGIAGDLHAEVATAICGGDLDACRSALASFSYDRTGFAPIDWAGAEKPVYRQNAFYQAGRVIALLIVAGAAWGLWLGFRKKPARRRPGRPPMP